MKIFVKTNKYVSNKLTTQARSFKIGRNIKWSALYNIYQFLKKLRDRFGEKCVFIRFLQNSLLFVNKYFFAIS